MTKFTLDVDGFGRENPLALNPRKVTLASELCFDD
jgi:hypothetical protein